MLVDCVGTDGLPPQPMDGHTQCVLNDSPPFNCERSIMWCISSPPQHVTRAGTFPYEVSLGPLPSGSHTVTVLQPGTAGSNATFLGGSQFFLPRK